MFILSVNLPVKWYIIYYLSLCMWKSKHKRLAFCKILSHGQGSAGIVFCYCHPLSLNRGEAWWTNYKLRKRKIFTKYLLLCFTCRLASSLCKTYTRSISMCSKAFMDRLQWEYNVISKLRNWSIIIDYTPHIRLWLINFLQFTTYYTILLSSQRTSWHYLSSFWHCKCYFYEMTMNTMTMNNVSLFIRIVNDWECSSLKIRTYRFYNNKQI